MSDQSTPVQSDVNDAVTAAADQQRLRVAAATQTRSKATRRIVIEKPADAEGTNGTGPARRVPVRGTKVAGKAKASTKQTTAKVTPAPVSLTAKESAELARQSDKIQAERVNKAREVLARGDEAQWEVARLSFEATVADGPAKMDKQDWADRLGVAPSTVSRWLAVHAEYGLAAARQFVGKGTNRRELSFNDHVELVKADEATRKEGLKRMAGSGHSFATEVRRLRDEAKAGTAPKSPKDKAAAEAADLINQVAADEDTRLDAFVKLGELAIKAQVAFRQGLQAIGADALNEQLKQAVRNVLSDNDETAKLFESMLDV